MQILHHSIEPVDGLNTTDSSTLHDMSTEPAVAYAQEVRVLRQRVAELEAELAAVKATTSPARHVAAAASGRYTSEFTQAVTPAVVSVQPAAKTAVAAQQPVSPAEPTVSAISQEPGDAVGTPGFAQAWTAESNEASFEERIAEKAFFRASTVDEQSRSWLLDK